VRVTYRQAARDDVVRQFRYYLLTKNLPEIAVRFRDSVRRTMDILQRQPRIGPRYLAANPELESLRSFPVVGFEAIRIYYLLEGETVHVIRVLHGKRDVKSILEREESS